MKIKDFFKRFRFTIILIVCVAMGTFLRLYLIADQILLDDEWHGLFYSTSHSLTHLLRYTTADATCAPLNAYAWILLHTIGWSEMALRLPSIFFGIFALVICPLLVRKVHGETTAAIFSVFMSLSPFLTTYSRIFRPYGALVFFEFVAIYSAGIWLLKGERRFGWFYVLASMAAVYFHPVAAIGVFAPWVVVGTLYFLNTVRIIPRVRIPDFRPDWKSAMLGLGMIIVVFGLTVQPGVIAENVVAGSSTTIETWHQFLLMLFGTSSGILSVVMLFIFTLGLWILIKEHIFWGLVFTLVVFLHLTMIAVSSFSSIHMPVVLARYMIIIFPLAYVATAIGMMRCAMIISRLTSSRNIFVRGWIPGAGTLILLSLIMTNPLWNVYDAPNNFTHHSAFIESGRFAGWSNIYPSAYMPQLVSFGPPTMPTFYGTLQPQTRRLIEYPMLLGDHYNYYYFYQHHHRKKIIIGYTDAVDAMPPNRDCVYPEFIADHVINAAGLKHSLRFRNMVNIQDKASVRNMHADYLICHKDIFREFLPGFEPPMKTFSKGVEECLRQSTDHFGKPIFEDENIAVFNVRNTPPYPHLSKDPQRKWN